MPDDGVSFRTARGVILPILYGLLLLAALVVVAWLILRSEPAALAPAKDFDGQRAYQHVLAQMEFGPRVVGSDAHQMAGDYILEQLNQAGWPAEVQPFDYDGIALRNFVARANVGGGPIVIVGAHYDSRRRADQDPAHADQPVPGANDGASGVAVLLELARSLDRDKLTNE